MTSKKLKNSKTTPSYADVRRETSARALLKEYVAAGVMERVPMSRGYYRPAVGNFGW